GRYIPFAPPLHSPKDTSGTLSPKQHLHLCMWRGMLRVWPQTFGRIYTSRRPLFLIGCHNSGTTILAQLIGNHRDIVNWSEAPDGCTPAVAYLCWGVMHSPPVPRPFVFDMESCVRTVKQHGEYLPLIRNVFTIFEVTRLQRRFVNKNPHMCLSIPYT